MKNKYDELVKILKENNLKIEKNEFNIVKELIQKRNYNSEDYKKYFKLSNKAQAVADTFRFGDIDETTLESECYLVTDVDLTNYFSPKRKIYIAKNKSQLLYIFLNKTNGSQQTQIVKYALDGIEI